MKTWAPGVVLQTSKADDEDRSYVVKKDAFPGHLYRNEIFLKPKIEFEPRKIWKKKGGKKNAESDAK